MIRLVGISCVNKRSLYQVPFKLTKAHVILARDWADRMHVIAWCARKIAFISNRYLRHISFNRQLIHVCESPGQLIAWW